METQPCPMFSPPARGPGQDWVHPKARAQREASQPLSRCPPASSTSVTPHWGGPQETPSSMFLFNRHLMTTSECRVWASHRVQAEGPGSCRAHPAGWTAPGNTPTFLEGRHSSGSWTRAKALSPLCPGKDSAPGEGGWRDIHTPALRGILPQRESEGLERGGACKAGHSPTKSPPREDPSRERREVWGPWAAGLAWVCPAVRLGLAFQSHGSLGGYVPGMRVCAPMYLWPCLAVCVWVPVTAVHTGVHASPWNLCIGARNARIHGEGLCIHGGEGLCTDSRAVIQDSGYTMVCVGRWVHAHGRVLAHRVSLQPCSWGRVWAAFTCTCARSSQ